MPRKKRKKLKFTEESLNEYMQEIYDDSFNIRAQINTLFRKWEAKVKEGGEVAAMGDTIVKLIGAMAKNQDQRIMILRYLKEIVFEIKEKENESDDNGGSGDSKSREEIIKLAQEAMRGIEEK